MLIVIWLFIGYKENPHRTLCGGWTQSTILSIQASSSQESGCFLKSQLTSGLPFPFHEEDDYVLLCDYMCPGIAGIYTDHPNTAVSTSSLSFTPKERFTAHRFDSGGNTHAFLFTYFGL